MTYCRICIDDIKKPVSLPCGHIFCSECIVKTIQNVTPHTHLHPCPICRSVYNIAPINMNIVPPNLRPFVTPSIRRLYLDAQTPEEKGSTETGNQPSTSSMASELQRLRAENEALRSNCAMWRKRAEMHGTTTLGLINFAKVVRDQAALLSRERDTLQTRCRLLARKVEDIELAKYPEAGLAEPLFDIKDGSEHSKKPDPTSLLFAPLFRFPSEPSASEERKTGVKRTRDESLDSEADVARASASSTIRPEKRSRTEDLVSTTHATGSPTTSLIIPQIPASTPPLTS